jgi:hypothetical protein
VVALFTVINVRGVQQSAKTMEVITIVKILPLLLFVLVGAAFVHPSNWHWQVTPPLPAVPGTAGVVIFAFTVVILVTVGVLTHWHLEQPPRLLVMEVARWLTGGVLGGSDVNNYLDCRSQLQMSGFWLLTDVAVGTLLMPLVMDSSAVFLLLFSSVRQWPSTQ